MSTNKKFFVLVVVVFVLNYINTILANTSTKTISESSQEPEYSPYFELLSAFPYKYDKFNNFICEDYTDPSLGLIKKLVEEHTKLEEAILNNNTKIDIGFEDFYSLMVNINKWKKGIIQKECPVYYDFYDSVAVEFVSSINNKKSSIYSLSSFIVSDSYSHINTLQNSKTIGKIRMHIQSGFIKYILDPNSYNYNKYDADTIRELHKRITYFDPAIHCQFLF